MKNIDFDSQRIKRLPPYFLGKIKTFMMKERARGIDVIDLGMGNPDRPTPPHIVEKLCEVAHDPKAHRYSMSKGIPNLRKAIVKRYKEDFNVDLDPDNEVVAVIGAKEGISHLAMALLDEGDVALVPNPTYPIHLYSVVIAGANLVSIPLTKENNFVIFIIKRFKLVQGEWDKKNAGNTNPDGPYLHGRKVLQPPLHQDKRASPYHSQDRHDQPFDEGFIFCNRLNRHKKCKFIIFTKPWCNKGALKFYHLDTKNTQKH